MAEDEGRVFSPRLQSQPELSTPSVPNRAIWTIVANLPFSRRRLAALPRSDAVTMWQRAAKQIAGTPDDEPSVVAEGRYRDVNRLQDLDFELFPSQRLRNPQQRMFDIAVFIFEFLTHLLYPLSIPVVVAVQGQRAAVNKGYITGKPVFVTQLMYSIVFLLPIVMYVANSGANDWAIGPVAIGSAYTLFRMLVIAGKYASFKRSKYLSVLNSDYECVKDLLLTTITVSDDMLEDLIEEAEIDSGIHLKEMKFVLADGITRINARVYTTALARFAYHRAMPGSALGQGFVRSSLGFLAALYPVSQFFARCDDRTNVYSIFLLVANIIQTVAYSSIIFGFIGFAILYYSRIAAMKDAHVGALLFTGSSATIVKPPKEQIYHAVSSGDFDDPTDAEHADLAMIPACLSQNLVSWATVGNVLCRFAGTTTRRISFNFIATLAVAVFLAGVLVLQAVGNGGNADIYLIGIVSYLFSVFAIGMLYATFLAFNANRVEGNVIKKLEEENFTFLWREILHHPTGAADEDDKSETYLPFTNIDDHAARAEEYSKCMEVIRELISRRNEVEPLRVMYVAASMELVSFFASIAVSGGMLIVGLVYRNAPGQ